MFIASNQRVCSSKRQFCPLGFTSSLDCQALKFHSQTFRSFQVYNSAKNCAEFAFSLNWQTAKYVYSIHRDFVPQLKPYLFKDAHKILLATSQKSSHLLNQAVGRKMGIICSHLPLEDSATVWNEFLFLLQFLNSFHSQHQIICKLSSDIHSHIN